jgi:alpha-L-fucosidase
MSTVRVPRTTPGDSAWFTQARFGLFIHWGLYAMGARHEWQQKVEAIPAEAYEERYFTRFDPDLFSPDAWAEAAAAAGMKYVVVVAKHQEGFCLWDSALTDYKAPNTPAGRDLLRPLLDAFRSRGMRVGLYYALVDWHHPDFTVDYLHPLVAGDWEALNAGRDMDRFRAYIKGQLRELLDGGYGPIDIVWPDFSYDEAGWRALSTHTEGAQYVPPGTPPGVDLTGKGAADWDAEGILRLIRELQPQALVNDRLGLPDGWDISTPEQAVPDAWPTVGGEPALWEACQTFAGRWGYNRDDASWKSTGQLVEMLAESVSKGGNLLLNVGPNARGELDPRALERLAGIGAWMRLHSRAIYGCTQAPDDLLALVPGGMHATYDPQRERLYLHLPTWPAKPLRIPGLGARVAYAQLLHDGSEVGPPTDPLSQLSAPPDDTLWLNLPRVRPDVALPVLELFLRA